MRQNVGNRIMEIADTIKAWYQLVAWILGGLVILTGIIFMASAEYYAMLFVGILVMITGVLIIMFGNRLAEVKTIKLYGFGIIVDKMENWDPSGIQEEGVQHRQTSTAASSAMAASSWNQHIKKQEVVDTHWYCSCGYKNHKDSKFCDGCGKLRS